MIINNSGFLIFLVILSCLLECTVSKNIEVPSDRILRGETVPLKTTEDFGEFFLNIIDRNINRTFLVDVDEGRELTYRQVREKSIRFAIWLRKHNISSGDIIAVAIDNGIDDSIPMISSFIEGVLYSTWPHDLSLDEARSYIRLIQPKVMVFIESTLDTLKKACELENHTAIMILLNHNSEIKHENVYHFNDMLAYALQSDVDNYLPMKITNLSESAIIVFTSGSTGLPKGVVHSYNALLNSFIVDAGMEMEPLIKLWYTKPSWTTWNSFCISVIYNGGVRILHRNFDVDKTPKIISKYKVNSLFLNPVEIAHFVQSNAIRKYQSHFESVDNISTAGSVISDIIFDRFKSYIDPNVNLGYCYGLTEVGLVACMNGFKKRENHTANPVGFLMPNVQMKITDQTTGQTLGSLEVGEILIKSPNMFQGYYKNPEKTMKVFNDEGWFYSGDIGFYDNSGEVYFVDRIKDMMKFQTYYVIPAEIENLLRKHAAVEDAVIVPVPDMIDGERPMAYVVKTPGIEVTERELVEYSSNFGLCRTLWGGVKFVEDFPRTLNKKIDKVRLKKMAKAYEKQYNVSESSS